MTTISDQKMVEQVKSLEKSMCTLVKAFKELKSTVTILEDKVNQPKNKEIQEIRENHLLNSLTRLWTNLSTSLFLIIQIFVKLSAN